MNKHRESDRARAHPCILNPMSRLWIVIGCMALIACDKKPAASARRRHSGRAGHDQRQRTDRLGSAGCRWRRAGGDLLRDLRRRLAHRADRRLVRVRRSRRWIPLHRTAAVDGGRRSHAGARVADQRRRRARERALRAAARHTDRTSDGRRGATRAQERSHRSSRGVFRRARSTHRFRVGVRRPDLRRRALGPHPHRFRVSAG